MFVPPGPPDSIILSQGLDPILFKLQLNATSSKDLYLYSIPGHLFFFFLTLHNAIARPRGVTPMSEVRGSGREYQSATAQEPPRGATLPPRSGGGVAERSYPTTLRPRPGATARRSYPTSPRTRPGAAAGRSNPRPRPGAARRGVTLSHGCAGTGGHRGAIPH